jgi:hypothetical protein
MEVPQGNSQGSYLKQTKMSFLFLLEISEQEGGTGPACVGCYQLDEGGGGLRT